MRSFSLTQVQHRYPIRYWFAIAFATGIPCFVKFDATGKTHDVSLFNPWTLSTIALTLCSCAMIVFMTLLSRQKLLVRKVNYLSVLWVVMLIIFAISSLLTPRFPGQSGTHGSGILVSTYRLAEWIIAFVLILSVYTRESPANSASLLVKMITTVCCLNIACIWLVLPISPSLAYSGSDDVTGAVQPRLGGYMIAPSHLGLLCGIAFFYFLLFWKGAPRIAACAFMIGSLFLTYARGAMLGFFIVLLVYVVLYLQSKIVRTLSAVAFCAVFGALITFSDQVVHYMARGHSTSNITTLSDRTLVWQAAFKAFQDRPWIGYGFIQGVKGALKEHWTYKYWIPPHCHNDLIQAAVSGGIVAALCLLMVYMRVLWSAFRLAKKDYEHLFFLLTMLQLCIYSFLGPLFSAQYSQCGAIFFMCILGVLNNERIVAIYRRVPARSLQFAEVGS
jgi:O-antigen ligase